MTPAEIEQMKLSANFLNNVGVAIFGVSVIGPFMASLVNPAPFSSLFSIGAIGSLLAFSIHLVGRNLLRGIDG